MRFKLNLMSFRQVLRNCNRITPLYPIEVISVSVVAKSFSVSKYDEKFSEINEALYKRDNHLIQHSELLIERGETIQLLKNDIGNSEVFDICNLFSRERNNPSVRWKRWNEWRQFGDVRK